MPLRPRPGMSLVELMVSVAIGSCVALGVTSLAVREVDGRASNQEELLNQQAMASILTTFSQDVRSASGLVRANPTDFRVRKALTDGTYQYVSYRILDGKLQRGVGTQRDADPATWVDTFDSNRFTVASGEFTYFELGNRSGSQQATMRRIEISRFQLRKARNQNVVKTPPISAVMREGANARDLGLGAGCTPEVRGHANGANAWASGSVHVTLCATNQTARPITLDGFAGDWASGTAANPIEAIKLENGGVLWGQGQAEYLKGGPPQTFRQVVTLPPGGTQRFRIHFHSVSGKIDTLTMRFYEPADAARKNPYLITARLP